MKKLGFIIFLWIGWLVYSSPQFRISQPYWDFGKIREGTKVEAQVKIKNVGDEVLIIKIRTSCECLNVDSNNLLLSPLEEKIIKIKFNSKGYSGKTLFYVFFDTNDPKIKHLPWVVEGEVVSLINYENFLSSITIKMFYTRGCIVCEKIKRKLLPQIEQKLNIKIYVEEYLLEITQNYEMFVTIENQLGYQNTKIPAVVVGKKILSGEKEIEKNLYSEIKNVINQYEEVKLEQKVEQKEIIEQIKNLTVIPILVAGIIDGVNPCAFATIIFLIAYMLMIKKQTRKKLFLIGIFFIFGVFVTYLLIGIGLSKIVSVIKIKSVVGKIFYIFLGIITLVFAVLSFVDMVAIKKIESGSQAKVYLQLPGFLRMKIYDFVDKTAKFKYIIPIGFFLGIGISLIEFFCTGQIYLPTIMYMFAYESLKVKAFFYLVLYCLMYVLPLVIIFVCVLFGLNSEIIEEFNRRYTKTVKFLTGFVFLVLSILMFSVVF
jgi:cytochrome c biogenesis protein CcdA